MKLALIHADPGLATALLRRVGPGVTVCWSEVEPARADARPAPDFLLLDARSSTPAVVRRWQARGSAVVLLIAQAGSHTDAVYAALDAGAFGQFVLDGVERLPELLTRLERWSALRPRPGTPAGTPLIALGASAGGPQALATVLAGLPAGLPAAIVVALHYASGSARELAGWLQSMCRLPVAVAASGDAPIAGRVAVADAGGHLELGASGGWQFTPAVPSDPVCPSVDRLFQSLATASPPGAAALLTGMGSDGAEGLLCLRRAGWHTVAQDAASRVYGMPRAAAEAGAAVEVLPLEQIPASLLRALSGRLPA